MSVQTFSRRRGAGTLGRVLWPLLSLIFCASALQAQPDLPPLRTTPGNPFPDLIFADSPLFNAIANGNLTGFTAALEKDPTLLNATHKAGYTPLGAALRAGQKEIAELLLAKGADLNAGGSGNNSPLLQAIQSGKPEMVQLLLDKGVALNSTALSGYSPLYYAMQSGDTAMFK
ncbi:MAG: ankyrin repeat domain-containing protein, partial [Armatimonadota bacterium]|nr:ankyrin repeat domain-containing protein [Armatimonadota bacterium]